MSRCEFLNAVNDPHKCEGLVYIRFLGFFSCSNRLKN